MLGLGAGNASKACTVIASFDPSSVVEHAKTNDKDRQRGAAVNLSKKSPHNQAVVTKI
jgi:hypothetical protein